MSNSVFHRWAQPVLARDLAIKQLDLGSSKRFTVFVGPQFDQRSVPVGAAKHGLRIGEAVVKKHLGTGGVGTKRRLCLLKQV